MNWKKITGWLANAFMFTGAIAWGLYAVSFQLVPTIVGYGGWATLVYSLVGLSAVWKLLVWTKVVKE